MSIELKHAAQQAIEAIQDLRGYRPDIDKAIEALRAALSQQPATRLPEDVVIGHVTLCKGSNISLLIEYAKRLNADVERLEAQQPATSEPVGYMNEGHIHELAMRRLPYGYVYPEAGAGASTAVYPHPAPGVPDGWRRVFESARNRLQDDEPSAFDNSGYRSYASNVLDGVEDELEAIDTAMLTAAQAQKGQP